MLSKGPAGYTYDTINRLTRVGASDDYEYDPNGNRASRESGTDTWTYGYDSFNRFTSVSRNSISSVCTPTTLTIGISGATVEHRGTRGKCTPNQPMYKMYSDQETQERFAREKNLPLQPDLTLESIG